MDVESGYGDRQQTHRSENRETAAYVVGDYICLVAFGVGESAKSTALGVGHSHDTLAGFLAAELGLELLAQNAECNGRLGSGARLGNHDDTEFLILEEILKLGKIVLAYVLTGEKHLGAFSGNICVE